MHKWPPAVINHMVWRQRELEEMHAAAKVKYRQRGICQFVCLVARSSGATCIGMWRAAIWTWPSCGGAQCR